MFNRSFLLPVLYLEYQAIFSALLLLFCLKQLNWKKRKLWNGKISETPHKLFNYGEAYSILHILKSKSETADLFFLYIDLYLPIFP